MGKQAKERTRDMKGYVQQTLGTIKGQSGQTLVEYVLIIALIAVAAIVGMKLLGGGINSRFDNVNSIVTSP